MARGPKFCQLSLIPCLIHLPLTAHSPRPFKEWLVFYFAPCNFGRLGFLHNLTWFFFATAADSLASSSAIQNGEASCMKDDHLDDLLQRLGIDEDKIDVGDMPNRDPHH